MWKLLRSKPTELPGMYLLGPARPNPSGSERALVNCGK
uniref:Uncharacterized protein n=1 Tax=Anguilla anguilla TaxID=7936 RepID=A0A0E9W0F6_ANGAN